MAINLSKNRESLLSAWKDVLDDKTSTDWALFGYEGHTNDLKLVSKGSGGVEELVEDLNSGKIMYAYIKVMDPKTSLPKNVLVNWQGEGAPNVRKGTCANHIRDVGNFFKGAHVTLNARTEEEVDAQIIVDKVAKSTGSTYSFKERGDHCNEAGPVGTTYKRVIPKQEINAQERDRFWEKEEEEERKRQEGERKRKEEERRKLEEERKRREVEETAQREERIKERSRNINQIREAEKSIQNRETREATPEDPLQQERERQNRSEVLRRERSQEAQTLIAKRTIDARAVFEQNTSTGQLHRRRSSEQSEGLQALEKSAVRKASLPTWNPGNTPANQATGAEPPVPAEPITVRGNGVVNHPLRAESVDSTIEEEQEWEDEVKHDIPPTHTVMEEIQPPAAFSTPSPIDPTPTPTQPSEVVSHDKTTPQDLGYVNGDLGLTARALYDYQAADATEITFDPGDVITHIDQIDEGWWHGLGPDGVFGLFPANYVELIN